MTELLLLQASNEHPLPPERWTHYLASLPTSWIDKIQSFHKWQDRQAALFGKLLIQEGLKRLHLPPTLFLQLQTDTNSRPFLPAELDFNLSHSGGQVICAFSQRGRLGIDVEQILPIDLEDFRGVFTEAEWQTIVQAPQPEHQFYQFWTRKEAVVKAVGKGLQIPLKDFSVLSNPVQTATQTWHLQSLPLAPGYACHLASQFPVLPPSFLPIAF